MANQKFIFTGDVASIDKLFLRRGDEFEADPDWIRDQEFPAVLALQYTADQPADEAEPNKQEIA